MEFTEKPNRMAQNIVLVIILILIGISIYFLQRPETIVEEESGTEVTLGPLGEKVAVEIGNVAQDFRLTDYDGEVHQLSDYRGQPVMLNFWATWCPFCIDEMPLFEDIQRRYIDTDLEIIAVNRGETLEQAREFTDPMNLTYTLLLNRNDDVAKDYQVQAMPTTLFINPDGSIFDIKFGPIEEGELIIRLDALTSANNLNENKASVEELTRDSETAGTASRTGRQIFITDGEKHSVPLNDIRGGGPPKDGIPSIDDPKFTSVAEADEFLQPDGIGVALSLNGIDRFYPNQITVWHEIVNDNLGGTPALVTYCPLCGTGIVFDPTVDGKVSEFGTSGKLWNSNLIMYDRNTDTYWSQVLGEAIVGERTGDKLDLIPYDNVRWSDWKAEHPDGEVLSRDTGYFRDYTESPYGDYDFNDSVFFPVDHSDDSFQAKEPTFGIVLESTPKVYPLTELRNGPDTFSDEVAGIPLTIEFDASDDTVIITRADNGEEVVPFYGFWFSWVAAHPETEIYTAE